jgi:hypothetical protein
MEHAAVYTTSLLLNLKFGNNLFLRYAAQQQQSKISLGLY